MSEKITARDAGCSVPLAGLQRLFWRSGVAAGRRCNPRYFALGLRIVGPIDVAILEASLRAVIQRHEPLRTSIGVEAGVPFQRVAPATTFHLEVVSIPGASAARRAAELEKQATAFSVAEIDRTIGPLYDARLFRLAPDLHVFVQSLDHMITDVVSNKVIVLETWTLYQQAKLGLTPMLPPPALQFADYAVWQERGHAHWRECHEPYWRRRLGGAPRMRLPCDRDGTAQGPSGAKFQLPFGRSLSHRLRAFARQERKLLPLIMLTVYVAVLARWTHQNDFVLVLVEHGRTRPELQNMVGCLANHLHLRIDGFTGQTRFRELLARVAAEFFAAWEHQDFSRVPLLIPECDADSYFNWLPRTPHLPDEAHQQIKVADVGLQPYKVVRQAPPLRLALFWSETDAGISLTVNYRTDLFSRQSIQRFGAAMLLLSEVVTQTPEIALTSVAIPEISAPRPEG